MEFPKISEYVQGVWVESVGMEYKYTGSVGMDTPLGTPAASWYTVSENHIPALI